MWRRFRAVLVDALRLATYSAAMPLPRGFVPPCLPTKAQQPPSGDRWVHESKAGPGLRLNEHIEADGPTVFAHACKMGLEGIVSKHKTSTYRSGRSPDWLKMKNPACAAVKREAEEDWGSGRR